MDELDDAVENIRILVREELEVHHRLEGHPTPLAECPICARHTVPHGPSGELRGRDAPR